MKTMTILAFAFALCCHVVYAGDLHSMLSTYLKTAGCGTAQIVATNSCIQKGFDTMTGNDTCENFGKFSPCWPRCFCDSAQGFQHIIQAFKPQCTKLPPCGAALGAGHPPDAQYQLKTSKRPHRIAYEKISKH